MVDIDRLHRLFLNEESYSGRKEGHTTLFVWQLIGIAELDCFAYEKIKAQVGIPFNKNLKWVLEIIEVLKRTCIESDIPFAINQKNQFVILHTAFEFYRVREAPDGREILTPVEGFDFPFFSSVMDNDAIWRPWEITDKNIERSVVDTFTYTSKGFNFI